MPQAYIPPLDKCLAGEERLISWKLAYRTLCDPTKAVEEASLEAFLTDAESVTCLTNALNPFSSPSQNSRGEFETKTAPINVSHCTNGDYSLEELKKDVQWLSEKMDVEEPIALRIVMLEWQSRAEDALRAAALTIDNAIATSLARQVDESITASADSAKAGAVDYSSEYTRQDRQTAIYLEEKSYILKTSMLLVEHYAIEDWDAKGSRTWLDSLASRVTEGQSLLKDPNDHDAFCARCISALDSRIQMLGDTSKWPEPFKANDEKKTLYGAATTQDIVSTLRTLLANLYLLQRIPSHAMVTAWFKLMGRVNFFQDLDPSGPVPEASSLQCLTSAISLTVLQLPLVMARIQELLVPILQGALPPERPDESYIRNDACIKEINITLYRATQENVIVACPAIYAWSIIASIIRDAAKMQQDLREQQRIDEGSDDSDVLSRRRASRRDSKDDLSIFERQYVLLQDFELEVEARDDPAVYLARTAVDRMSVYSLIPQLCTAITEIYGSNADLAASFVARSALLDLVREAMPMVGYGAEILESILAILAPDVPGRSTKLDFRLVDRFITDDDVFRPTILDQAVSRYPYELMPMLKLLNVCSSASHELTSAGSSSLVKLLDILQTMTVMVPEHFRSYVLDHEDENTNSMSLTDTLPLFFSKEALPRYGSSRHGRTALTMAIERADQSNVFAIPSGSAGVVVRESRPLVFRLEHTHSGLEYLGLLLSTLLPSSELLTAPMDTRLDRATAAEIIALINSMLTACPRQSQGIEEAHFLLGRLAFALQDEQDIITIIADILEVELLAYLDQSAEVGSLDVLIACVEFFDKLVPIAPERVWSTLARSSLLGINGGASALPAVVAASEVTAGRFRFLAACVDIYSRLIIDTTTGYVKRNSRVAKTANRFDSQLSSQDVTPERTMITVLRAYQTVMIDVWQSLPEWRFALPVEKSEITTLLLATFSKLLRSTYGIDSGSGGIASLLYPSATALVEACTLDSGSGATTQCFSAILAASLALGNDTLPSRQRRSLQNQAVSAFEFSTILVRSARAFDVPGSKASLVASQLLNRMPALVCLFVIDHHFKAPLSRLLTTVVQALQSNAREPPSLLGQLSIPMAKSFLSAISQLDRPLCDIEVESAIWDLLCAVMVGKQQWFAIYLLTGGLPKDHLKNSKAKDAASKTRSLLTYALDQLSHISTLPPERAIAMLKFLVSAQNAWIRATDAVRSHSDFLKNSLEWLSSLQLPSRTPNMAEEGMLANEHLMAAYLCDIMATNLHTSNEIGDKTLVKMLPSKLSFLTQHAVDVNAYKRSLHHNLSDNFARKFPSYALASFKRTLVNPAPFGRKFHYDLDLADEVLGHETAWHGASNGRFQGFSDEFARANVNLSIVEAQTRLLKSWRILSYTLCECMDQDAAIPGELARTAVKCLQANVEANLEQPEMDQIVKIRVGMAFVLISRLAKAKSSDPAMKNLLFAVWDLVRTSPIDYDVCTSPEDLAYYRHILQVLYLAIQPHVYIASKSESSAREPTATNETHFEFLDPAVAACLVQITAKVIAPGFRALCGNLHNGIGLAQSDDFAIINVLLQAVLSVPGVSAVYHQLADVISSTSIVRGALSLYSWSDGLAAQMSQDPIYGEVAIVFLLSLSSIRPVAEQMALDGVLTQLASANLSNYFRKPGGRGPFSEPRRMFVIWTQGLLPLCLNLLDAVGPPMAAEVSAFLNSFPQQLQRANAALENREATRQNPYAGAITLSLVSEAHSLCLIALILASDTARGAAEGIDAADVPALNYDYEKLKEDAAGLMRQKTSLASRLVPVGEREEELMTGGAGMKGDNLLLGKVVKQINELVKGFGQEA